MKIKEVVEKLTEGTVCSIDLRARFDITLTYHDYACVPVVVIYITLISFDPHEIAIRIRDCSKKIGTNY